MNNSTQELQESARVVAVEDDAVWLETIRHSSCGQCQLQKGCGQSLLQSLFDGSRHYLKVSTESFDKLLKVDDEVIIAIPNAAVVQGSMLLYAVPLLMMLAGMVAAHQMGAGDGLVLLAGAIALALSLLSIRWFSERSFFQRAIAPKIVSAKTPSPLALHDAESHAVELISSDRLKP